MGLIISEDVFLRLVLGAERSDGGVILSDDALAAAIEIAAKAQAGTRHKTKLTGESLDIYIAKARQILKKNQEEIDRGGRLISKREFAGALKLGESTVRSNPDLNGIYENFKAMNSRIAPSTVNNDYICDDEF